MTVTFQLGKSEIDQNFIETIRTSFKKHDTIKIKVLESHSRDKQAIKKAADDLAKALETEKSRFIYKMIGFTIILIKRRKSKQ